MAGAKKITVTSSEMAYILGATPAQMSGWVRDLDNPIPVIEKTGRAYRMDPQSVVRWWFKKKLDETLTNRNQTDSPETSKVVNFHLEKTRLTKAQADEKELKLQAARGELIPLQDVAGVISGACQILSSALSSIPAELQRVAPHLSASDIDAVRRVLARVQNGLADQHIEPADIGLPSDPEFMPGN